MTKTFAVVPVVGLALAVGAFAQGNYPFGGYGNGGYNNNGYGYGTSGKCTVEVEIDQAADVLITGSNVQLRTLAGSQASLVRTNCNASLPMNPTGFRFQGIDGRGRQTLLVDPNSNRGTAVVRLEDPNAGRERYTFDLMWSGDNGGYDAGVYNNGPYGYPGNGYPGNGYPGNGYPANGGYYPNRGYPNNYPVYGNNGRRNRRGHRDDDWDDRYRDRRRR